jgi:hypothetical protein
LIGVHVSWRSKARRSITLSSNKAEYVAISEAVKKIKLMYFLLQDIGFDVELPIVVKTGKINLILNKIKLSIINCDLINKFAKIKSCEPSVEFMFKIYCSIISGKISGKMYKRYSIFDLKSLA